MRYDALLRVSFTKNNDNPRQEIPPLLLIHLIENAFKHGASETMVKPYIDIQLTIRKGRSVCIVENSRDEGAVPDAVKDNIGLANLRRQPGLLFKEQQLRISSTPRFLYRLYENKPAQLCKRLSALL